MTTKRPEKEINIKGLQRSPKKREDLSPSLKKRESDKSKSKDRSVGSASPEIKPSAVPAKALQTFPMAHDLLKLLIAKQDMENLARITRPRLFKQLSDFISNVNKEGMTVKCLESSTGINSLQTSS